MTQTQLKYVRLVVPGLMVAVLSVGLWASSLNELAQGAEWLSGTVAYAVLVVGVGALYKLVGAREPLINQAWEPVNEKIIDALIDIGKRDPSLAEGVERLHGDYRVMKHCFYKLVDNDETLKAQMRLIYMNGAFVSSTIDLHICALVVAGVYFAYYCALHSVAMAIGAMVMVVVSYAAMYELHPRTIRDHLRLSGDQLEYIRLHKKDEVVEYLGRILADD